MLNAYIWRLACESEQYRNLGQLLVGMKDVYLALFHSTRDGLIRHVTRPTFYQGRYLLQFNLRVFFPLSRFDQTSFTVCVETFLHERTVQADQKHTSRCLRNFSASRKRYVGLYYSPTATGRIILTRENSYATNFLNSQSPQIIQLQAIPTLLENSWNFMTSNIDPGVMGRTYSTKPNVPSRPRYRSFW